jgi:hypothetical protein
MSIHSASAVKQEGGGGRGRALQHYIKRAFFTFTIVHLSHNQHRNWYSTQLHNHHKVILLERMSIHSIRRGAMLLIADNGRHRRHNQTKAGHKEQGRNALSCRSGPLAMMGTGSDIHLRPGITTKREGGAAIWWLWQPGQIDGVHDQQCLGNIRRRSWIGKGHGEGEGYAVKGQDVDRGIGHEGSGDTLQVQHAVPAVYHARKEWGGGGDQTKDKVGW